MTDGGRLRLFDARPRQPRGAAHVQGRSARALWTEPIEKLPRAPADAYSLVLLLRWPCSMSCFSSAGVSFGRSSVIVSFASLPVNSNGTL